MPILRKKEERVSRKFSLGELEGDTFEGLIKSAQFQVLTDRRTGMEREYLVLQIEAPSLNTEFSLKIPYSERKNSLWGKFLQALEECQVSIASETDLENTLWLFERQNIEFGADIKLENFPLPKKFIKVVE